MKRIFTLLLALCALTTIASAQQGSGKMTEHTLRYKGNDYTYWLYLPNNLPADAPLVMVFHGYNSRNIPSVKYGLNEVADRNGFAVCYPRGPKDNRGKHCWAVGYSFHLEAGWERDDVGFACRLVKLLQKEYGLSRKNVFATGHSNGGEMCYLLAYSNQSTFRAVAPIAGLTMAWMPEHYTHTRPIPLFEVHGTEDRTSEWTGDMENKGGWGAYMAVPEAIDYWIGRNGCDKQEHEELPLKTADAHKVIAHRYIDSRHGNDVWLYEIIGGGHTWGEKDLDIAEEIWKFFSKFTK